jgi:hypothetical protein
VSLNVRGDDHLPVEPVCLSFLFPCLRRLPAAPILPRIRRLLRRVWFGLFSHSLFAPLGALPEGEGVGTSLRASERASAIVIVSEPSASEPDRKGLSGACHGVGSLVVWCTLIATVRSHYHQSDVLLGPSAWSCSPISTSPRFWTSVSIPQIGYVGGWALSDPGSRGG